MTNDRVKNGREKMLKDARRAVVGDRDKQYGGPEENFAQVAAHWSLYLQTTHSIPGLKLTPEDVAAMQVLLKIARIETGGYQQGDTWTDIAGYSACGYEIAMRE